VVTGSSLKAALDLNWDELAERTQALGVVLGALASLEGWLEGQPALAHGSALDASVTAAQQVRAQDVVVDAQGQSQLRDGVAKDRRITIEDAEMRHGRKSRRQRVDGFKRHVLRDLDTKLIRAVGVTPANVPEATVTDPIMADLGAQQAHLAELHIDRAYLSSPLIRDRPADLAIYCKAWPVRNGDRFPKTAFTLDFAQGTICCPHQIVIPFQLGQVVHFPGESCAVCPRREQCTRSLHGRSVSIHPDEHLLHELRERQQTTAGRAKLRERVAVEHSLAQVGQWQGTRARYRGVRKNLFDLRRVAVVHNLHVLPPLMATHARAA
jgi:hypothetical protein